LCLRIEQSKCLRIEQSNSLLQNYKLTAICDSLNVPLAGNKQKCLDAEYYIGVQKGNGTGIG
jgi:4-hydroxyphenylpyruvate dioxygenase-like putative hemolysin